MPNGTAHTETSSTAHGATPRRRSRTSVTRQAATMPATMHSAYARTGRPRTCQTAVLGLGMRASVTDAHATAGAPRRNQPGGVLFRARRAGSGAGADAFGQLRAERLQPGQPGGRVGGLQHA